MEQPPASGLSRFEQAAARQPPRIALVLGSGMSELAENLSAESAVPFSAVPELTATSVPGHPGMLLLGDWEGARVLLFAGRLHAYEGHSWETVVAPARIAARLGARMMVLVNAAGGIVESLVPGALMAIRDHIEWTRPACWRPPGPRRVSPYSGRLLGLFDQAAAAAGIPLQSGIYAAVTGPSYETRAEIRALRAWGAWCVGMSTAREAQAAFDAGLEVAGLSLITNRAAGLGAGTVNHEEVLAAAAAGCGLLGRLLGNFLARSSV